MRFAITNGGSLVSAHAHAVVGDIDSMDGCQPAGNLCIFSDKAVSSTLLITVVEGLELDSSVHVYAALT